MTAALACFDTERHGHSLFPPLFTPGTGIPLSPPTPNTPSATCNLPPTYAPPPTSPTPNKVFPLLPPPAWICPLRASPPRGPLHPPRSQRFPLAQACCFHFIWDAKSSFTGIRAGREGKTGPGLSATGGMRRRAGPAPCRARSAREAERGCLESSEPTEQDSSAETFQNSENLETHVR